MDEALDIWKVIDRSAEELGVAPEARKKWRQRRSVPHRWRLAIMDLAAAHGKVLSGADFELHQLDEQSGRAA